MYPPLLILYCLFSVALIPPLIAPLILDYVKPESLGLVNALSSVAGVAGSISATSGFIRLQTYIGVN